jgi:kynurenine formamidase
MNEAEFSQFAEKYRNWGRWGDMDEAGTLNFVTSERIIEAAHLIRKGRVFSLAVPFNRFGPQRPRPTSTRFNPIHTMLKTGTDDPSLFSSDPPLSHSTDDMITMPLQASTQWDSLAHIMFRGRMYNNRPHYLVTSDGAQKNSIDKISNRVVGRGVLLDIPRYKNVDWLELGQPITIEDLEGACQKQDVVVKEGDFLLVRTGHVTMCKAHDDWGTFAGGDGPGLSVHTVPWLYEKRVASAAADNFALEALPSKIPSAPNPLHLAALVGMGLLIGEIFDLDELAADCAQDGIYEFFFVAPPLPVTGAVGSPINPYAIK